MLIIAALVAAACSSEGPSSDPSGQADGSAVTPEASPTPAASPARRDGRGPRAPSGGRRRLPHAVADQARRLPDQGEPDVRQPLRHVPGRRRGTDGMDHGVRAPADQGDGRRLPTTTSRTATSAPSRPGTSGPMDGFNQGESADRWAYTQLAPRPAPQLLALGQEQRALRQLLRERARTVVPESPVLDRRAVGRRARQPPARVPSRHARVRTRWVRRAGGAATWRSSTAREIPEMVPPCFDFLTEGDLLNRRRHPVVVLRGDEQQKGYIWSAYSAIRRYRQNPERWQAHIRPSTGRRGHRGGSPAARDLDHPAVRGLRAPRVQLLPRRELVHRGDQRDDAQRRCGRTRRSSSPGTTTAASTTTCRLRRSTTSDSASACPCSFSARTRTTGRSPASSASSRASCASSRTTGASPAHAGGTGRQRP